MRVGQRVVIVAGNRAGAEGVVTATIKERGCGCVSVFVRLARGEWFGKASEVRPL